MKTLGRMLLGTGVVLALAGAANATTLYSPLLQVVSGQYFFCWLSNVGAAAFTPLAPNTAIRVQVVTDQGVDVTTSSTCGLMTSLPAGQSCYSANSTAAAFVRCAFTFKGSKALARGSAMILNATSGSVVAALPAD
jgi:hypothetical protein